METRHPMVTTTARQSSVQTLALPVGFKLFWYEIRAVLGQGGFGITYLAHDTNLDQLVAIKEYLPVLCATRGTANSVVPISQASSDDYQWGLGRFLEEGRVLAKFDHQAVVRVHSVFEALETAYLVMRYENGETLGTLLKREPRVDEPRLRAILFDVMSGLEAMHTAGFVHRDVKPSNIYLRANGQALLIDFGAARQGLGVQTQTVTSLVSPGYAPFEQYRSDGAAQGPWTDIYGLGATAYRVITGRAPVPAIDRSHRIINGSGDPQPRLTQSGVTGYSFGLLAAIDRALAFREQERPRTIAAWRELFETDEPVTVQVGNLAPLAVRAHSDAAQGTTVPAMHAETDVATLREPLAHSTGLLSNARRWPRAAALGIVLGAALGFALLKVSSPQTFATTGVRQMRAVEVASERRSAGEPGARPASARALMETPLAELLRAAEVDMAALRLSLPEDNNALAKFRAVLVRDPNHTAARSGVDRIVGRYLDLATAAAQKQDFDDAREYLTKASQANPRDRHVEAAAVALTRHEANPSPPQSG